MSRRDKGQEAVEFVLISIVVFFACLFVLLVFGEQIAAFFQNNPTATDKEIAVYSESDGIQTDVGPASTGVDPGTIVTLPLGNGNSVDITIPDTSDYISTTGSSGDTLASLGDLLDVYGDLIDDISSEEGANANLARLAEVIKSIGDLQGELYPTYQVDDENQKPWLQDLDSSDPDSLGVVKNFLDSLEVTFDQMQNRESTTEYVNAFIGTDNPVTDPATYDQMAYAHELQLALSAVNDDPTISSEIKDTVGLLVDQVEAISNNTSYVIDNDLYTSSFSDLIAIKATVDTRIAEIAILPTTTLIAPTIELVPTPVASVDTKVAYITELCTSINSDPTLLESISADQKETLIEIAKTINIQINQPPESILNMDLAGQVACIADPVACSE